MNAKINMPLEGIKVLELGHIVAGPTAGQILADLGADVIKIESVDGGDQARAMPGASAAMFHFFNRNKRSVALDLKGEGKAIFLEIAKTADVVLDNFAYGVVDRLGVGYGAVSGINEGIVWLSIKGFLPGPAESRPLLDELAQMMGGLAFMTGTVGKPARAGASIIDVGAATYGVIGVLAALRQRDAGDGRGQHITAGLFETSVYWVAQWMATAQFSGERSVPMAEAQQGTRLGWGVYRLFETADHVQVFIAIVSNAHWARFCKAFDLQEMYADPRFADGPSRLAHRPELNVRIETLIGGLALRDVTRRLQAADLPFTSVLRPDELAAEPQLAQTGQLMDTPLPNGITARLPKLPFRAGGFDMSLRKTAPALGADTRTVLAELGYRDEDIAALQQRGVVRASPRS